MFGSKVSDLLLAEKNLIDFVEKNLGQEKERLEVNELQLEAVCHHLAGGLLDYPPMISHDFCDITTAFDIYIEVLTRNPTVRIPRPFGYGIFPEIDRKNERHSKMPFRGDELSQRQFINAIVQSTVKIRNHVTECTEQCTTSGRYENFYVIISNVVIIKNYIWTFQQFFREEAEKNAKLKEEFEELGELVECISNRMLQCQKNLLTTFIIHDEISQGWASCQSYYEGHRASPTIPMWTHFLKEMQRDMWKIMPPKLSQRILGIILNDSLAILAGRYSSIQPSEETMAQFCADILNILGTVEELLYYVSANIEEYCGNIDPPVSRIIFSIHMKCQCLVTTLVLVGAPLEILYKTLRRGLSSCSFMEKYVVGCFEIVKPMWMNVLSVLCSKYYPTLSLREWQLVTTLRLVCSQATLRWILIYKVIAMNEGQLTCLILSIFSNILAPTEEFLLEGKAFKKCLNAGCTTSECHSIPKSISNHHVSSSILYLLAHTIPRDRLARIYHPLLLEVTDWDVMDKTSIWTNMKRPVWFQSLIDILLPILKVCLQSLCLDLLTSELDEDDDSTRLVTELLNCVTEILSVIPRGLFLIFEEIEDLAPACVTPVRNNVSVHFLVSALYQLFKLSSGIISSVELIRESLNPQYSTASETLNDGKVTKDIQPILHCVSERLCHLDDGIFDQAIHRLVSQLESMMRQTRAQLDKKRKEGILDDIEISDDLAATKTSFLLEEPEGQLALRHTYWFLVTHENVLLDLLIHSTSLNTTSSSTNPFSGEATYTRKGDHVHFKKEKPQAHSSKVGPSTGPISTKENYCNPRSIRLESWTSTYYKVPSTLHNFHYVNRNRTFDEIVWNFNDNFDWISVIRTCKMGLNKYLILKQLERRPDFQTEGNTSTPGVQADSDQYGETNAKLATIISELKALLL